MSPSSTPVALVVGASRGIGRQLAIDLARNGYAVAVAAKTVSDPSKPIPENPDPNSPDSTITTVTREIVASGGQAIAVQVDVRYSESVDAMVDKTISTYGRLDLLVYNSGAIHWGPATKTPLKRFILMQRVNPEGLYATIQAALPHLSRASATHGSSRIVVVSPPIYSRFFRGKAAYAVGKVGMSVLTKGLSFDIDRDPDLRGRMAITSIWPAVAIQSAATDHVARTAGLDPASESRDLRTPAIFSDAVLAILAAPPDRVNGELLLDEDFLRDYAGVTDFSKYSVVPGATPHRIMPLKLPDLTVAEQADEGKRIDLTKQRSKL